MSGFEHFLFMLGAITFAGSVTGFVFCVVGLMEKPRRRK